MIELFFAVLMGNIASVGVAGGINVLIERAARKKRREKLDQIIANLEAEDAAYGASRKVGTKKVVKRSVPKNNG